MSEIVESHDDSSLHSEIKAFFLAELAYAGIIERTGEIQWSEYSRQWEPLYAPTGLGRALFAAGISPHQYLSRAS